jgi:hypothetical protein
MKSLGVFALFAASAMLLAGCGPTGPVTHTVSGTVTFDGVPVAKGDIIFRDAAGQDKSYGGQITDGKFSFESSPGKKKVEINAMREVPGKMDTSNPGAEVPLMEQYIPKQYNTESTLTAEVPGSGDFTFDLKSNE